MKRIVTRGFLLFQVAVAFLGLNDVYAQSADEILLVNRYQPNKKYVTNHTAQRYVGAF